MNKPPKITEHEVSGETVNVWHPDENVEGFCISHGGGGWMPGSFNSIEAALMGVEACFKDEKRFVLEVQQPINHFDKQNRLITVDDLQVNDNECNK